MKTETMKRLVKKYGVKTGIISGLLITGMVFAGGMKIMGGGATFPAPLYLKMFDAYTKKTGIAINYQAIGSGAGIKQLIAKTVDFGGSDAPLNAKETRKAGAEVIHVPTCLGAIVLSYNVPGLSNLKLTPDVLSGIYLGKITHWNDAALAKINPGVKLPNMRITVVHRSDSSGTSYNFTVYLSSVSRIWGKNPGVSKNPKWPVGIGGKGNDGVAASIKQIKGSIGYIELAYAFQNKMPVALLKNKSGIFIDGHSFNAVGEAANIAIPANGKVNVVNTSSRNGYPIAATTWILLYKDQSYTKNKAQSEAVVNLIWWMIHEGQAYNEAAGYAKLPPRAVKVGENLLRSVVFNGKPLLRK